MKIGEKVIHLPTCSSTNDVLRELAEQGEEDGVVVLAEEQTAGRGTKGRSWFSPRGKGLYLSVLLRPERESALFPLMAGVAVAEAIAEEYSLWVRLRWPNDLIWEAKKLGGILCESSFAGRKLSYVIIGIGLNLNQLEKDFPVPLRKTAVSLKMILQRDFLPEFVAGKIFTSLSRWYNIFQAGGDEQILKTVETLNVFQPGDEIAFTSKQGQVRGQFLGLDRYGRLVVRAQDIIRTFTSGEVLSPVSCLAPGEEGES
ncbi:biotin--[acetyl-CoA-carboxylase] ligase [Candidatus Aminicenantes bacterium AC-334-K16]|jgi:BirA family biotin operon repressor/biotin-[acetyl-CoA-carboxylase] ligase|nr:biotin--[acetyl-CoA-carboxylase] ligase [Candidatus Aminicenantes bacterium AC-334-K16]